MFHPKMKRELKYHELILLIFHYYVIFTQIKHLKDLLRKVEGGGLSVLPFYRLMERAENNKNSFTNVVPNLKFEGNTLHISRRIFIK